jgi:DNA invertase Pin-like site-specific DNA recombinase
MPKKGPDENKIKKIKNILRKNKNGVWIREIARQTKISKSTVHFYINKYLQKDIEDTLRVKGNHLRFVRLKE